MSSCSTCRHEKNLNERAPSPLLQCPACRVSSFDLRLRIQLNPRARISSTIVRSMKASVAITTLIASAIVIQDYDPSHPRSIDLASMNGERRDLSKEAGSLLSVCLYKLARLGQTVAQQNKALEKTTPRIDSLFDTLHISQLFEDPPPQLFLAACLSFAFAIAALQHLYKADIYLSRILVLGLMVGCALAFQTTSPLMELKSYLAWSVILAVLLSVVVHWAMRLWQDLRGLDARHEMEVWPLDKSGDHRCSKSDHILKASQR
ncbi:hypothetical protein N431DRAFT_34460 [Stipitochalara longipes BDJ]|nr:hypothetical protein N431DRAFT_34460 [Stipitochalara longipes BDJ]